MFESKKIKALKKEIETLRKQLDIYKDKEIARLPKSNICKTNKITGVTTDNPFQPIQYFKYGASGTTEHLEHYHLTNKLSTINNENINNMSNKYRKKPVVIQAVQWTGKNHQEIVDFTDGTNIHKPVDSRSFSIPTLEGEMLANVGDYIIKGVKGEFYPCKPDIFELTYDKINN